MLCCGVLSSSLVAFLSGFFESPLEKAEEDRPCKEKDEAPED